jgi:7-cyano-7-deazaguanine reductase
MTKTQTHKPASQLFDTVLPTMKTPDYIQSAVLETFPFDGKTQYISIENPEFSAVCPFSGLPDVAHVQIEYYPEGGVCIELKSLKYYFFSFRDVGIYQEAVTKRILDDLSAVLATNNIRITTKYNVRGGLYVTCKQGILSA